MKTEKNESLPVSNDKAFMLAIFLWGVMIGVYFGVFVERNFAHTSPAYTSQYGGE